METKLKQLNHFFCQLNMEEQESILHLLETLATGKNEPANRISIEEYNIEIEAALAEAERGETLSHEEVVALSKQW